jgi:hypothetical protein
MKPLKPLLTVTFLCFSLLAYSWRIEGDILIIEKGDNLWKIAHSLYAKGYDYGRLWRACMDTTLSKNPNVIYEDMRFNLDSMRITDTTKATAEQFPVFLIKEKESFDWATFLAALVGAGAAILAAWLGFGWVKNNEINKLKTQMAFEFHKEFHSEPIHKHRIQGNKLVIKNYKLPAEEKIITEFHKFSMNTAHGADSIFVVFNFYNRLWSAIDKKQVDNSVIPGLFGDIFFYWYDYCFGLGLENMTKETIQTNTTVWQSQKNMFYLKEWLEPQVEKAKNKEEEEVLRCRVINKTYIDNQSAGTDLETDHVQPVTVNVTTKINLDELKAKVAEKLESEYELKKKTAEEDKGKDESALPGTPAP